MPKRNPAEYQDLYVGLVRLHVLHAASQEPVFGLGMLRELGELGFRLGPGTMYPLLHSMERRGWLKSKSALVEGRQRKVYAATRAGKAALAEARQHVQTLAAGMRK